MSVCTLNLRCSNDHEFVIAEVAQTKDMSDDSMINFAAVRVLARIPIEAHSHDGGDSAYSSITQSRSACHCAIADVMLGLFRAASNMPVKNLVSLSNRF